jgi:putative endonuclease
VREGRARRWPRFRDISGEAACQRGPWPSPPSRVLAAVNEETTGGIGMQEKRRFYVYILTNKLNNVLYTGVTSSLKRRMEQHKAGGGARFTSKYRTKKLVYIEKHDDPRMAVVREQQIKAGSRGGRRRSSSSRPPIPTGEIYPVTCERQGGGDGHAPPPRFAQGPGLAMTQAGRHASCRWSWRGVPSPEPVEGRGTPWPSPGRHGVLLYLDWPSTDH